jgi:hypothetical protein
MEMRKSQSILSLYSLVYPLTLIQAAMTNVHGDMSEELQRNNRLSGERHKAYDQAEHFQIAKQRFGALLR